MLPTFFCPSVFLQELSVDVSSFFFFFVFFLKGKQFEDT